MLLHLPQAAQLHAHQQTLIPVSLCSQHETKSLTAITAGQTVPPGYPCHEDTFFLLQNSYFC